MLQLYNKYYRLRRPESPNPFENVEEPPSNAEASMVTGEESPVTFNVNQSNLNIWITFQPQLVEQFNSIKNTTERATREKLTDNLINYINNIISQDSYRVRVSEIRTLNDDLNTLRILLIEQNSENELNDLINKLMRNFHYIIIGRRFF